MPADDDPAKEARRVARRVFPVGGFASMWGVLMAAKSDDPAEQRRISRDRRRVAVVWIALTLLFVVLVLTGVVAVAN